MTDIPTIAYVACHIFPVPCWPFGGKNGAVSNATLRATRNTTAALQALNGRFRSGRVVRSQSKPREDASANTWPGYPSTSRMNE